MSAVESNRLVLLELSKPTGWHRAIRAAMRRVPAVTNYPRWRYRFAAFGFGSVLESPHPLMDPRFVSIGRGVQIRHGARIEALESAGKVPYRAIGDGTSIHMPFHCRAAVRVEIGRNVSIAARGYITDHDHMFEDPDAPVVQDDAVVASPTVIEDNCWLGKGSMVLKGCG